MNTKKETTALHQAITKGELAADVLYALGYHFEALHGKKPRWVAPKQDNIDQAVKALKDALKADMEKSVKDEEDVLAKEQREYMQTKIRALKGGRPFGVHVHLVPSWHKYREQRREAFMGLRFQALHAQMEGPGRHPHYEGPVVFFALNHGPIRGEQVWLPLECIYLT